MISSRSLFSLVLMVLSSVIYAEEGITCTYSGGGLGDTLLSYYHAKWLSYHYNIPFYYSKYPELAGFVLDDSEQTIDDFDRDLLLFSGEPIEKFVSRIKTVGHCGAVPHFPDSEYDRKHLGDWPYFEVDWEDEGFVREIKERVRPKQEFSRIVLPKDKITVALHVRTGEGRDSRGVRKKLPLKFPPLTFYQRGIEEVSRFFEGVPIYVTLFTDAKEPEKLLAPLKKQFKNIEFTVAHGSVIEDFFNLMEFDCAVHPDSGFSICAGYLANYAMEISPKQFRKQGLFRENVIEAMDVKIWKELQGKRDSQERFRAVKELSGKLQKKVVCN